MVVLVVLVVLVVVGGEVRLGNLVNQGLSSARQAAILASECSQPARGSAASDESVQVRQIKVTLLSLATLHILAQQPWPLATSPCSRQNLHPPLPSLQVSPAVVTKPEPCPQLHASPSKSSQQCMVPSNRQSGSLKSAYHHRPSSPPSNVSQTYSPPLRSNFLSACRKSAFRSCDKTIPRLSSDSIHPVTASSTFYLTSNPRHFSSSAQTPLLLLF